MHRLLPIALVLLAAPAPAQAVEDYFHRAAQLFVAGEMAPAEAAASAGLRLDPSDQKLRALLDEIRKKNPDDSGGRQEQDADQQRPNDGGQPQDADQPQDEGEQQEPGQQGKQQQEGPPQEPDEQGEPQDEGEMPPEDADREAQQDGTGQQGQQPPEDARGGGDVAAPFEAEPGQMSRTEAERILRALEADEVELLRDVQRRRARPRYVEQDW